MKQVENLALNVTPGGMTKSVAQKSAQTAKKIATQLQDEILGLVDKTKNQLDNAELLEMATKLEQKAEQIPSKLLREAQEMIDNYSKKIVPETGVKPPAVGQTSTQKLDLTQEARKYKSAEDFVNSKPSLFHTTSKEAAQSIEQGGFKGQIGERSAATTLVKNKGVFLYDDISPTKEFGKNIVRAGKEPAVVETRVNGKIFNSTDEYASINALAGDTKLINKLKAEGYVGIRGEEMGTPVTFVFDTNALKTKSQLTDIWKEANKK